MDFASFDNCKKPILNFRVSQTPNFDLFHSIAHPRSLIRNFDGRSMEKHGSNVSSGETLRILPNCTDEYADLNICCPHIPACQLVRCGA